MKYVVLILFSLTACSSMHSDRPFFRDRDKDYLLSENRPDFKVPEDMSQQAISKNYYLPDAQITEPVSIYPPT